MYLEVCCVRNSEVELCFGFMETFLQRLSSAETRAMVEVFHFVSEASHAGG